MATSKRLAHGEVGEGFLSAPSATYLGATNASWVPLISVKVEYLSWARLCAGDLGFSSLYADYAMPIQIEEQRYSTGNLRPQVSSAMAEGILERFGQHLPSSFQHCADGVDVLDWASILHKRLLDDPRSVEGSSRRKLGWVF